MKKNFSKPVNIRYENCSCYYHVMIFNVKYYIAIDFEEIIYNMEILYVFDE